jgi:hypothetical protein
MLIERCLPELGHLPVANMEDVNRRPNESDAIVPRTIL